MSTTNKKSTASKALIEMDSIMKSIKEESKSTMKALLSEAVKDALRDNASEDDEDENDYEVVDDNAENETNVGVTGSEDSNEEEDETEDPVLAKYKVGKNTYDLTGEEDNSQVVKVYKLLSDEDQVIIKKDGDKVELKDNETGAEYVIDFGEENGDESVSKEPLTDETEDEEVDQLNEGLYELTFDDEEDAPAGLPTEDEGDELVDGFEGESLVDVDDNTPRLGVEGETPELSDEDVQTILNNIDGMTGEVGNNDDLQMGFERGGVRSVKENKTRKNKKTMKESKKSKEVLFEIDLGYTDNYQKEDPIEGLSNNEPSKSGKSWHKGVPTGTEKPWAGKTSGKGDPFAKGVNEVFDECGDGQLNEEDIDGGDIAGIGDELEEGATSTSSQSVAKATLSRTSAPRAEHKREVAKNLHTAAGAVNEIKKLKKENKALQEAVLELRNSLKEAYITNVNLGKITKLFLENTTTKAEKIDIINRFTNEAKTIDQSKSLYESINKQLKKAPQMSQITENNAGKTMTGSKVINETKRSKDVLEVIDLMDRMKNC